jgi:ligand-binding sensor domain-containing protein
MRFKIIIFFFILFIQQVHAQYDIRFNHHTIEDGLPDNTVQCMQQDEKGLIWFGTKDGLCCSDGYSNTIYKHRPGDSTSISGNSITCLCEDKNNLLWIGTTTGLSCYDPVKRMFTNFYFTRWSSDLDNKFINALYQDKRGNLWVGTLMGLYSINIENRQMKNIKFTLSNDKYENKVCGITGNVKGRLIVVTFRSVLYSDDSGKIFKAALSGGAFSHLYSDKNEKIWFGDWGHPYLYELDSYTLKCKRFIIDTQKMVHYPHYIASSINALNDSILIIGTQWGGSGPDNGGVLFFNWKTGKFKQYNHEKNAPHSLNDNHIFCILIDRQQTVWIGTENGADYFNYRQLYFHWLEATEWGKVSLSVPMITGVAEDKNGSLWITTFGSGLMQFTPNTRNLISYSIPANKSPDNLLNTYQSMLFSGDTLLLASREGLVSFSLKDHSFNVHSFHEPGLKLINSSSIASIVKTKNGNYWFGTFRHGIYEYNSKSKKVTQYLNSDSMKLMEHNNLLYFISEDTRGNIWAGFCNDGFCKINPVSGEIHWNEPGDNRQAIEERGQITDIYCAVNGDIYLATSAEGLIEYSSALTTWKSYTTVDGLADNNVQKLVPDMEGNLWCATLKGLSCFDLGKNIFRNFYKSNGLASNIFTGAGCCSQNGEIFLADNNTVEYYYPAEVLKSGVNLFPSVTGIEVLNKGYFSDFSKKLFLTYKDNVVSVNFSAFDFINEKEDRFAYLLEGFDEAWVYCGNRHFASYTNLPGGDYTFRLKVRNASGNWVESANPVFIHFSTPYWKTWWFLTLCWLSVFSLGYLVYYLQMQRKVEAEKIRSRLARDLHDDIGSALSSISIFSDVVSKKVSKSGTEDAEILNKISNTANEAMQNMSDIVWSINPGNDAFVNILTRMQYFASQILEAKNIALHFNASTEVESEKLTPDLRHNFYLIFKEVVNNIAKYSEAKNVDIKIRREGRELCMDVKDDGIGFDEVKIKSGNGLNSMKKRAENLRGHWQISSSPGSGTHCRLRLPIP